MFLIFDTETTGLPKRDNAPLEELDNWPRLVQLAWQMHDITGKFIEAKDYIIKPEGFTIPYAAEKVHGISTEKALKDGHDLKTVLKEFAADISASRLLIAHNIEFDINIVASEFLRNSIENDFLEKKKLCTKVESTDFCAIPGGRGGKFKWPNLKELHEKLFNEGFPDAHNASADVEATTRCFLELIRIGVLTPPVLPLSPAEIADFIKANPEVIKPAGIEVVSNKTRKKAETLKKVAEAEVSPETELIQFTHLHVHTQYSILDGAASIAGLIQKAKEDGMKAMAITDHGNLFGAKIFHNEAKKQGIKPIIGCEVYIAKRSMHQKEDKIDGSGDHLILLAKNKTGYHNLIKLVSLGWTEGMYYKPRIDKEVLKKYAEGLIASTACLGGEVPQEIMNHSPESAGELIEVYKGIFGEDFYLELMRHKTNDPEMNQKVYKDQVYVNNTLLELGEKYGVKCIATNDVHFINAEDAGAHDRLICLSTGKDLDDPSRMKYTQQEWLKTRAEMMEIFKDIPQVLINTQEIVDKVEVYALNRDPIMPDFPLPEGFDNEDDYLRHLSYKGAERRYKEITTEIQERIDFELEVVKNMGFPGYFLIVQDFINEARNMGVAVGPGRGSAAGSVVAYCTGITDIDPLRYNLLFERFLNPDRISLPDIDIDFDEDGREEVLRWVVNKYGKTKVAQIITFGTMAAKMAIRDVARIQKLPLSEADRLAKLVPERPGTTLKKAYEEVPELRKERDSGNPDVKSVLEYAGTLEGSVRHTGIHACGIIIGRDDLTEHIPICISKDSDLLVTQFDGKHVEDVGMLKMDFLGLKTLSIIKDAVTNVFESRGIKIDISNIPIDDALTYELYAKGDTTGLFQFESAGMRKHLRDLKPNRFEDLIAMNALYRPGPMEYIPSFIKRKQGQEQISYRVPEMEEELKETYGITVYQEQVMRLSQRLAGFTRGEADSLRKAMGKKIRKMMDELKSKFVEGCKANGHNEVVIEKIWSDWEAFAEYAFNKSHSTCYAYVSYQTAYLKAHYPAEFMAAVLSRNITDIKKIGIFMDECRRMGTEVRGPDVNESNVKFTVTKKGNIRFGLGAIKGVGESAVATIIEERKKNGPFVDIYDFIERMDLRIMTRKNLEGLAASGAFDCFPEINRAQYFEPIGSEASFFDALVKYGSRLSNEKNSTQQSLFGDSNEEIIMRPLPANIEDWPLLERINREKELIGMYLTAHPLDRFRPEIKSFCNVDFYDLNNRLPDFKAKDVTFAGIIKSFREGISQKNNRAFGIAILEDFVDTYQLRLWGNDFVNYKKFFSTGVSIMVRAGVEEWKSKKDNRSGIELRVKSIHLLSEVRNEMVRTVLLTVKTDSLNNSAIEGLSKFIGKPEKKTNEKHLRVQVVDKQSNLKVDLFSRTQYLNLNDEFFDYMEANPEIEYSLK
ncbi:MAG: DNA polymerase III subunit alpha [Bacteroidales bacterium]|nr:DNA polymerase III subunit alpha [Bacteroidales bacterium]MCB9012565.1 DNA polymerase III subunit alpha [Bacteroidales bacterium]